MKDISKRKKITTGKKGRLPFEGSLPYMIHPIEKL